MVGKRFFVGAIALTFSSLLLWQISPGFSESQQNWRPVSQAAPPALLQQLRQDYAPNLPLDWSGDIGQMRMLKLQQPGSLPLYLINTRVYPPGRPEQTPTCGTGGCLFLGYIPQGNRYRQVLNGLINDFQVQGAPPVIQPVQRTLNNVPCFSLTAFNPRTQSASPSQVLCFNGGNFVPVGNQ